MEDIAKTDCMEPIAKCVQATPIPYRFQCEKCKKKSWELQAYTYTAFVAPLQYIGNQKTLHYATANNLCFCITWQSRKSQKSHFSLNLTVLHAQCTCALSSWKKNMLSVMCLITFNICWDSKIFHCTVHWLILQAWWRTTPIFHTATDTVTDLAITEYVDNRQRMLCSLPRSCLVHPVDRFDSEGWFGFDQVIF